MNQFIINRSNNKMKKSYLNLLILALVATLAIGGTIAWFLGNDTVTNTFNAGTVVPAVIENGNPTDGMTFNDVVADTTYTKNVQIRNTGVSPSYIRVKITPSWVSDGIVLPADNVVIEGLNTTDWAYLSSDGYYYYRYTVAPGASTAQLFSGIKIDSTVTGINNADYQDATLNILIAAEAVQSANNAANNVWGVDPSTL